MRRPFLLGISAALLIGLLLLAESAPFGDGSDAPPPASRGLAHEVTLEGGGAMPPGMTADRLEFLRESGGRDKRTAFGLVTFVAVLASAAACLVRAVGQRISIPAGRRSLRGVARGFAARSPPSLQHA